MWTYSSKMASFSAKLTDITITFLFWSSASCFLLVCLYWCHTTFIIHWWWIWLWRIALWQIWLIWLERSRMNSCCHNFVYQMLTAIKLSLQWQCQVLELCDQLINIKLRHDSRSDMHSECSLINHCCFFLLLIYQLLQSFHASVIIMQHIQTLLFLTHLLCHLQCGI